MVLKPKYSYTNSKNIWRIHLTDTQNLVLEERDEDKNVFFSCINSDNGSVVFTDLQLEEKSWIGIEAIEDNKIIFHKFIKPDMPYHKSVIVYDIDSQQILWQNESIAFAFVLDRKVYAFESKMQGSLYATYSLDTGEKIEEIGYDEHYIRDLSLKVDNSRLYRDYLYPEPIDINYDYEKNDLLLQYAKKQNCIENETEIISYNNYTVASYQYKQDNNFVNVLAIIDSKSNKIVYEDKINFGTKIIKSSFYLKGGKLFIIKNKAELDCIIF